MTSDDKLAAQITSQNIFIIGPNKLQNQLLVRFLEKEIGAICSEGDNIHQFLSTDHPHDEQPILFLWDCFGKHIDSLLAELRSVNETSPAPYFVAPFNVPDDTENEQSALDFGIRGFFYEHDTLNQLVKGIRAIFSNELWVSREILTKRILNDRGPMEQPKKSNNLLTTREIEVLGLIAGGIKNEEIADQLCISPHTVRTHIYNIFKKINVPNRLQAALWAVKNL